MALSSVTITGGEVLIKYVLSGVQYTISSGPGSFSIDNGGTSYKWIAISGSPTLSAPGFTSSAFVQITSNYKIFTWDIYTSYINNSGTSFTSSVNDFNFTSLLIGSTIYTFDTAVSINNSVEVGTQINLLKNASIESNSYKSDSSYIKSGNSSIYQVINSLVIDVKDLIGDVYLIMKNSITNSEYFIPGKISTDTPTGFTPIESPCITVSSPL